MFEPLERGSGHTLGNTPRHILLSSVSDRVVVEAGIDGVLHECLAIEGVREDAIEILPNLKGPVIKLHGRDEMTLAPAEGDSSAMVAAGIQLDHDAGTIDGDHVTTNPADNGVLNIELKAARDHGYEPIDTHQSDEDESHSAGRLQFDASFSPVRHVSYVVENTCVEQRTNPDKLVLGLETNGTLDPEETIRCAAIVL